MTDRYFKNEMGCFGEELNILQENGQVIQK